MKEQATQTLPAVHRLIADWTATREAIAELERREHPDLTDRLGRVWTWKAGDLYRHCGMAWPKEFITAPGVGLPTLAVAAQPEGWCGICRGETES